MRALPFKLLASTVLRRLIVDTQLLDALACFGRAGLTHVIDHLMYANFRMVAGAAFLHTAHGLCCSFSHLREHDYVDVTP